MTRAIARQVTRDAEQVVKEQPHYRFVGLSTRGEDLLLPDAAPIATPDEVVAASQHALHMHEQAMRARAEVDAAQSELQRAQSVDASADRSAISLGQPMPTERATPTARDAMEAAQRRYDATRAALADAQRSFLMSIVQTLPSWLAEQKGVVSDATRRCENLLQEFVTTFDALHVERITLQTLAEVERSGTSVLAHNIRFGRPARRQAGVIQAQRAQAEQDLRHGIDQAYASAQSVSRHDLGGLIAALRLLVTPPPPPRPVMADAPDKQRFVNDPPFPFG
jgi:hypothetical protein